MTVRMVAGAVTGTPGAKPIARGVPTENVRKRIESQRKYSHEVASAEARDDQLAGTITKDWTPAEVVPWIRTWKCIVFMAP